MNHPRMAAILVIALSTALCTPSCARADDARDGSLLASARTVGLFLNGQKTVPGYVLFAPMQYNCTYLIDNNGMLVHKWDSASLPYGPAYLLENGNLLRTSKSQGSSRVQILDWNSSLVWDYPYEGAHHDVKMMPNGNVLIMAKDIFNASDALDAGRDPALIDGVSVICDRIVEVMPTGLSTGSIVWEWRLWDHLVQDYDPLKENYGSVISHPELIDINFAIDGRADWTHCNAVDYNPALNQVAISCRHLSEIWIIDRNTTTAQASSHSGGGRGMGGDILYRWGNPATYRAGGPGDQAFYWPHDVQWLKPGVAGAGNLMVFNNGYLRPGGSYSSVDEIISPVLPGGNYTLPAAGEKFFPALQCWKYNGTPPSSFYSSIMGGAQRLPGGNTLICSSVSGTLFEIDDTRQTVWKYVIPVGQSGPMDQGQTPQFNSAFRCYRYDKNYSGLSGRALTPGGPIEHYPVPAGGLALAPLALLAATAVMARRMRRADDCCGYASDGDNHLKIIYTNSIMRKRTGGPVA